MPTMKHQFKNIQVLVFVIMITGTGISLKAQAEDQMARFREEKIAFFNEKLALTDSEAEKFWPVHEDFHNRNMKINEDEKALLNYFNFNSEAMSDKEVDETITKFMDLQKKRQDLAIQYHNTFVEIIGKKKTMKMYSLDREFRMHVLKKFRAGGEGGGDGRGHGPGPGPMAGPKKGQ